MLFRQLFDQDSSTYTYLLADEQTREAVIIDPVIEQYDRDRVLIEELDLKLIYTLDTHIHADHVTGSGLLRERFGAKSVVSERAGVVCPDVQVKQGDRIHFGQHELEVRETPGHTSGCLSYLCAREQMVFTGDALLIRGCGRTDFQQGSAAELYQSVYTQLFTLPENVTVYPAHDYKGRTASSVGEERRLNPRLGQGKSQEDFIAIMNGLNLPYPRKIDSSLPANARCGLGPEPPLSTQTPDADWAPSVQRSSVGVAEVGVEAVAALVADGAAIIDVRDQDEYRGELGHIAGAELVPLSTLSAVSRSWPKERAMLLVCRSGGRSGKATVQLRAAGFARVASIQGGMREWNKRELPIERGYIETRQG